MNKKRLSQLQPSNYRNLAVDPEGNVHTSWYEEQGDKHIQKYCKGIVDKTGMVEFGEAITVIMKCNFCDFESKYFEDIVQHDCLERIEPKIKINRKRIKKAFSKIECAINSLECDVVDIKKGLNK